MSAIHTAASLSLIDCLPTCSGVLRRLGAAEGASLNEFLHVRGGLSNSTHSSHPRPQSTSDAVGPCISRVIGAELACYGSSANAPTLQYLLAKTPMLNAEPVEPKFPGLCDCDT